MIELQMTRIAFSLRPVVTPVLATTRAAFLMRPDMPVATTRTKVACHCAWSWHWLRACLVRHALRVLE